MSSEPIPLNTLLRLRASELKYVALEMDGFSERSPRSLSLSVSSSTTPTSKSMKKEPKPQPLQPLLATLTLPYPHKNSSSTVPSSSSSAKPNTAPSFSPPKSATQVSKPPKIYEYESQSFYSVAPCNDNQPLGLRESGIHPESELLAGHS